MKQTVYVYISEVKELDTSLPSYIDENKITNKQALAEKHTAYSLLYRGAKEVFGIDTDISKLSKTENGKPVYPDFCFTISHSKGICAVALSKENVGIDIEEMITGERTDRVKKRILHPNETPDTDITELWTKKEAVFKLTGGRLFSGKEIDTTAAYHTFTDNVVTDKKYTLTVAAEAEFDVSIRIL